MIFLAMAMIVFVSTIIVTSLLLWRAPAGEAATAIDNAPGLELFFAGMCLTIVLALLHFLA